MAETDPSLPTSPRLVSIDSAEDGAQRKVKYVSIRGRGCTAVFAANDDVDAVLERWRESGEFDGADRKTLKTHAIKGWGTPRKRKRTAEAGQSAPAKKKFRIAPPPMKTGSAKQDRLAREAKALAAYKDEHLAYWGVIAVATVCTIALLGFV